MDKRPVTLLTGFLGSGKTTLLNALLKRPELAGTAVVINEFGETGIDYLLVERGEDNVQLLDGGCICCTVTTTLADTLTELLGKAARREVPPFMRVVVETTGLAEPEPMVRQLWTDTFMREHFVLDAIVVTIDTAHVVEQLARHPEARRQVAAAVRIVLTKNDLGDERQRVAVDTSIDGINKTAIRMTAEEVRADPATIVGIGPLIGSARRERLDAWQPGGREFESCRPRQTRVAKSSASRDRGRRLLLQDHECGTFTGRRRTHLSCCITIRVAVYSSVRRFRVPTGHCETVFGGNRT